MGPIRGHIGKSARPSVRRGKGASVDRAMDLFRALGWSPRDALGVVLGGFVTLAILINVLFLQSGSHPAPSSKARPAR